MNKKKAILFDLDGTLWDVRDNCYKSVNEITKKYNMKEISMKTVCSVFGLNKEESAKLYFPELDVDEANRLTEEISNVNIANLMKYGGNVYSNLEDTLIKLKEKYDLFIVSNTGHKTYIEAFLNTSKFAKYFKDYIAASEQNLLKSEAITKVINQYEIEKAVYVGDTIKDMEAANAANVCFIQTRYGFGKNLNTQYYIDNIIELESILEQIF